MGPALETFLSVLVPVLLVLAVIGFATRPFWKRIAGYFQRWMEHDRLLEEQQRAERECRRKAQAEIQEYCHDEILAGKAAVSSVDCNRADAVAETASNTKNNANGTVNTILNSNPNTGNVPETTVITRTVTLVCNENRTKTRTVGANSIEATEAMEAKDTQTVGISSSAL